MSAHRRGDAAGLPRLRIVEGLGRPGAIHSVAGQVGGMLSARTNVRRSSRGRGRGRRPSDLIAPAAWRRGVSTARPDLAHRPGEVDAVRPGQDHDHPTSGKWRAESSPGAPGTRSGRSAVPGRSAGLRCSAASGGPPAEQPVHGRVAHVEGAGHPPEGLVSPDLPGRPVPEVPPGQSGDRDVRATAREARTALFGFLFTGIVFLPAGDVPASGRTAVIAAPRTTRPLVTRASLVTRRRRSAGEIFPGLLIRLLSRRAAGPTGARSASRRPTR